jgi:hypothetical protein
MKCTSVTTAPVCFDDGTTRTSLVAHYEYGLNATGGLVLVATRYTDASGTTPVDTSGGTVTVGACAVASPDIEVVKLCDNNAGVVTEFYRKVTTTFDENNTPTTTTADVALDLATAYSPTGIVGACQEDCDAAVVLGVLTTWG